LNCGNHQFAALQLEGEERAVNVALEMNEQTWKTKQSLALAAPFLD